MSGHPTDAEKLGRMAGQIATFFQVYPEGQAVAAAIGHITDFWPHRLRRDFVAAARAGQIIPHPLLAGALDRIDPDGGRHSAGLAGCFRCDP